MNPFDEELVCEECGVKGAYETNNGVKCSRCLRIDYEDYHGGYWVRDATCKVKVEDEYIVEG